MTIETKYRTDAPGDGNRYVRAMDGGESFRWCETGEVTRAGWRYDVAQGTCDADDLPHDVYLAALDRYGSQPGYVDWPLPEPDAYGRVGAQSACDCCGSRGTEYGETCVTCGGFGWVRA